MFEHETGMIDEHILDVGILPQSFHTDGYFAALSPGFMEASISDSIKFPSPLAVAGRDDSSRNMNSKMNVLMCMRLRSVIC